jgi:hypothetical protein
MRGSISTLRRGQLRSSHLYRFVLTCSSAAYITKPGYHILKVSADHVVFVCDLRSRPQSLLISILRFLDRPFTCVLFDCDNSAVCTPKH